MGIRYESYGGDNALLRMAAEDDTARLRRDVERLRAVLRHIVEHVNAHDDIQKIAREEGLKFD